MAPPHPRWILFDLGGVLMELGGVEETIRAAGSGVLSEDVGEAWLRSPAVLALETGRISPEIFARQLVDELQLDRSPEDFLRAFGSWVLGWFDGIPEILDALRGRYGLAILSNTNAVHWPDTKKRFAIQDRVDRCFLSYQMGRAKPDLETFAHVVSELGCAPGEVLFIDDNRLNVVGAREAGLQAAQAFGGLAVRRVLEERGLL